MALVLTTKEGEGVQIGEDIFIQITKFKGKKCRVVIDCPKDKYKVDRLTNSGVIPEALTGGQAAMMTEPKST
jgi:hypothetical protein